ncbi:hypothetical protein CLIM01_13444 [Colletotrichum limetticola]|uniref:Uncharacterized protein n=1 Tax=Colletotrichum limetticola TaxID=1209924 RepID=A0ABQ9PEB2_9PEZI|nr:hypothetical protein CLIM01_13444 [Colletotrichum limetticola]
MPYARPPKERITFYASTQRRLCTMIRSKDFKQMAEASNSDIESCYKRPYGEILPSTS